MSDIRVFVTFPPTASGSAIFAGETLQCKITFKNVSAVPGVRAVATPLPPAAQAMPLHLQHQVHAPPQANGGPKKSTATDKARGVAMSPRIPQSAQQGQRTVLYLPVAEGKGGSREKTSQASSPRTRNGSASGGFGHKHKRSISIVSMSSDLGDSKEIGPRGHQRGASIGNLVGQGGPPSARDNARRGHGRSASLQVSSPQLESGRSPSVPQNATFINTPIINTPTLPLPATPQVVESGDSMAKFSFPRRGNLTPGSTPGLNMTFKFPPPVQQLSEQSPSASEVEDSVGELFTKVTNIDLRSPQDGNSDNESLHNGTGQPKAVLGLGIDETPRSSGEFYSLANSTTETLVSEYDPRLAKSKLLRPAHGRRHSLLAVGTRPSEAIMMGYAQVIGTFTLDGTLVQTSQFEEIKRRGVVGGQGGGGVVGVEQKSDSKFLSSFGWGSFGGAIGGLLGGNNMSSIAEMKTLASQRSIPILSTPQSILFVDLKLAPGESRTYEFSFPLPKGLPPSHRGKAIKVNYVLKIGTQRAGKGVQQPKVVEIPFRVFPHVDGNGAFRTHDLLQPVILLRDEANVVCVDENLAQTPPPQAAKLMGNQESSLSDFLGYVDTLISPRAGMHLPSPSSLRKPLPTPIRGSIAGEMSSRENIEMAMLRGGGFMSPDARCAVFEIARNGYKVATLTLARPAYKLGDTITAVIDFAGAVIPCYHIHATLESHESISSTLALRSPQYILRATRKIHASHSESCLFAQRIQFAPTIPPSASPEFTTSCVSLTWRLNVEFITPALLGASGAAVDGEGEELLIEGLLEKSNGDDRGEVWEAKMGMLVESFDACIPVRVYPNVNGCDAGQGAVGGFGGGFAGVEEGGYVV
ncbi:Rgp1-domain-containing protein [Terfezia boudieri ATCC MYA-4762]|uniref:Rgp1-domain-containing protein n=1 Tax=Terfezia boudieri ATCC MYA-4762 TaxID=1051890 RepID=A0A3N4LYN7_9PEZI|nr:Rgp1-domain-containing protein [Terfezia boudieri ATCC MYA-4762]